MPAASPKTAGPDLPRHLTARSLLVSLTIAAVLAGACAAVPAGARTPRPDPNTSMSPFSAHALAGSDRHKRRLKGASCDEVAKAIAWASQSDGSYDYPVDAYLTRHAGLNTPAPTPYVKGAADQVWYASGRVWETQVPTPHLVGTLAEANNKTWPMVAITTRAIKVEIYADGTFSYQYLIKNTLGVWVPVGGVGPMVVQGTCVGGDLLMAIDGGQVIALGVARSGREEVIDIPK